MPLKPRQDPYAAFNFIVDKGGGVDPESVFGGFQEVTGLGTEVSVAEYRNGNDKANHVRKYATVFKSSDVTLKRGVMAVSDLYDWIKAVREGDRENSKRNVTISLRSETGSEVVASWVLFNCMPIKLTGPVLGAKSGGDVAIEECVLSVERIDLEK